MVKPKENKVIDSSRNNMSQKTAGITKRPLFFEYFELLLAQKRDMIIIIWFLAQITENYLLH